METAKTINREELPTLIPLSEWNKYIDFPKVGTLRRLTFKNTNDFNKKVVKRIETRMYIDVKAFYKWIEDNQEGEV